MEKKLLDLLPDDLERLGRPLAEYKTSLATLLIKIPITCLVLFVGGGSLFAAMTDKEVEAIGKSVWAGISLLILLFGIYLVRTTVSQWYLRVLVFEEGMLRADRTDYVSVRWADIVTVWESAMDIYSYGIHSTVRKITIQTEDGDRFAFDSDIKNAASLVQTVQNHVTPILLAKAIAAINANEVVTFGRIEVSLDGMKYKSAVLPWSDLEPIQLDQGFVIIRRKGRWTTWYKVRCSAFPNLVVFLELVNEIAGVQR